MHTTSSSTALQLIDAIATAIAQGYIFARARLTSHPSTVLRLAAVRDAVTWDSSWCMLDYRPTKNSQTQAEMMLAQGLPRAQEMLLRARTKAHPSLQRVAGHDPEAGTVTLEDVLVGGTATVNDQLLAENIDSGLFNPSPPSPLTPARLESDFLSVPTRSPHLPHDLDYFLLVALGVDRVGDQGAGVAEGNLRGFETELAADARTGGVAELVRPLRRLALSRAWRRAWVADRTGPSSAGCQRGRERPLARPLLDLKSTRRHQVDPWALRRCCRFEDAKWGLGGGIRRPAAGDRGASEEEEVADHPRAATTSARTPDPSPRTNPRGAPETR